eukprot:s127_g21.t1
MNPAESTDVVLHVGIHQQKEDTSHKQLAPIHADQGGQSVPDALLHVRPNVFHHFGHRAGLDLCDDLFQGHGIPFALTSTMEAQQPHLLLAQPQPLVQPQRLAQNYPATFIESCPKRVWLGPGAVPKSCVGLRVWEFK